MADVQVWAEAEIWHGIEMQLYSIIMSLATKYELIRTSGGMVVWQQEGC